MDDYQLNEFAILIVDALFELFDQGIEKERIVLVIAKLIIRFFIIVYVIYSIL